MASGVRFTVDTSEISALSRGLASMMGQHGWITARAMTTAAKAAKGQLEARVLPMIQGGPTGWTKRGLIASYASPQNLTSQVGFQYGEGKFTDSAFTRKAGGVPAGRYMGVNAQGGDRKPKATELALRRSGLIPRDGFITPVSKPQSGSGLRFTQQGNITGGQYQQMLSRLRALPPGSSQNAPQGRGSDPRGRSAKGRREADYFLLRTLGGTPSRWQLGADPSAIVRRAGPGPKGGTGKGSGKRGRPQTVGFKRGFVRAFNITEQPNYERRFPIQSIAWREYQRVFPQAYEAGLRHELERRARRGSR